jgi:hypothetical protein
MIASCSEHQDGPTEPSETWSWKNWSAMEFGEKQMHLDVAKELSL